MKAVEALRRRAARGDRGAIVVEFALVAPVLFLMMFGLADFALAELSDTAGANAALEGARVAILHYEGAHSSGANRTKITQAVVGKLAGNVEGTPTVSVRCLEADGSARPGGGSCSTVSSNVVDLGEDLVEVTVTWTRKGGIVGFIGSDTRTNKAVMRIVGTPPGEAPAPPSCELTAGSATPASVVRAGSDLPAITFSVTTNDASLCGAPLLEFPAQAAYSGAQTMSPTGTANVFELTMAADQGSWTSGTKTVTASGGGGVATRAITFVVNDPAVCEITSATASPSAVTHTDGTLSSAVVFGVTVSDVSSCGTPTLTFPAAAGYGGPQTMASAGGDSFTFTLPTSQGAGAWTTQTYTVTAAASGGGGDAEPISLVVSDAPTCSLTNLTISPGTASVKKSGQNEIETTVTIRVTCSSLTVCAVPTVRVTPGSSGPSGTATDLTAAKTMRNIGTTNGCTSLTCEWVIASGTRSWMPAPSNRTVTVAAGSATITGTLRLT